MPASAAMCAVAATVVAALLPCATIMAKSRIDALEMSSRLAIASSSARSKPTRIFPSSNAIVAGTAPASRTIRSHSSATSRLEGRGNPWLIIVDSRATTGRPDLSAASTSADSLIAFSIRKL